MSSWVQIQRQQFVLISDPKRRQRSETCGCSHLQHFIVSSAMATVVLVRYISIWKLFTVDSAALLHNFLLFVEISDKHDLFLEMSDLSCTPTVPPPEMVRRWLLQIRATTLWIRDNKRYCCFECPFGWAERLTRRCQKDLDTVFKAGSIQLQ